MRWEAQPVPGVRKDVCHGYAPCGIRLQHPPQQVCHLRHLRTQGNASGGAVKCMAPFIYRRLMCSMQQHGRAQPMGSNS